MVSLVRFYFDHNETNKSKFESHFFTQEERRLAEIIDSEITRNHAMIINGFFSSLSKLIGGLSNK